MEKVHKRKNVFRKGGDIGGRIRNMDVGRNCGKYFKGYKENVWRYESR